MRRRELLGATLSVCAAPLLAFADIASRPYRIGILTPSAQQWESEAFVTALQRLGYTDGQNTTLDIRSADGAIDRLSALARELVAARPDVIVAVNTPGAQAAIAATRFIPIVMVVVGDPVGLGLVKSLAHPGGNATGISNLSGELAAKRLSMLKELVPAARRIAILFNPKDPITVPQLNDTTNAAASAGVEVQPFAVPHHDQLAAIFERMNEWRAEAGLWLAGQAATLEKHTIELARRHKLPVMYALKHDVRSGGLVSYFAQYNELFARAATYVDKIHKGARPADLPVEQPTKFELVVNLKTARALGLNVPPLLLARADEVIE